MQPGPGIPDSTFLLLSTTMDSSGFLLQAPPAPDTPNTSVVHTPRKAPNLPPSPRVPLPIQAQSSKLSLSLGEPLLTIWRCWGHWCEVGPRFVWKKKTNLKLAPPEPVLP